MSKRMASSVDMNSGQPDPWTLTESSKLSRELHQLVLGPLEVSISLLLRNQAPEFLTTEARSDLALFSL